MYNLEVNTTDHTIFFLASSYWYFESMPSS